MRVHCVWEHNGEDTLLYTIEFVGAYTRGENLKTAIEKMPQELISYLNWRDENVPDCFDIIIAQEKKSNLTIKDADSDVLFESEKQPLNMVEYEKLKALALKSAKNFLSLYQSIPDKNISVAPARKTFYGQTPRSANEMYEHTKNVNTYYFAEIGVEADNVGDIFECRNRGFERLEKKSDFLKNSVIEGSYGELWTLRKVLRRFIWHDRIHARAMYRMATKVYGDNKIENPFYF